MFASSSSQRGNKDAASYFEDRIKALEKGQKELKEQTTEHGQVIVQLSGELDQVTVANRVTTLDAELAIKATR